MTNPLIPWLIKQIKDGAETRDIHAAYQRDPFAGEIGEKSLANRIGEVKTVLNAVDEMLYDDPDRATRLIQSVKRDNELAVSLKTYDITTEDDLRRWLGYEDKSLWKCKSFKARASQNAVNPWWIIEGSFEERESYPVIESVSVQVPEFTGTLPAVTPAVLSLSDLHAPFHDETCMNIAVQIARDLQPSHIILNGDMIDATDLSKWTADIAHRNRIQESLVIVAGFIGALREAAQGQRLFTLRVTTRIDCGK